MKTLLLLSGMPLISLLMTFAGYLQDPDVSKEKRKGVAKENLRLHNSKVNMLKEKKKFF